MLAAAATVSAVLATGVWGAIEHFADADELSGFRRCVDLRFDIIEQQAIEARFYARYVNTKVNVVYRAQGSEIPEWPLFEAKDKQPPAHNEVGRAMILWGEADKAEAEGDRLADLFRTHCRTGTWEE